jgi:lysophospholipid hydrolase
MRCSTHTRVQQVLLPIQDLARVARWMAGKAVGVVLSGGGSRGLAHLGVLNALDSAGVPIDVIGGTSQVPLLMFNPE